MSQIWWRRSWLPARADVPCSPNNPGNQQFTEIPLERAGPDDAGEPNGKCFRQTAVEDAALTDRLPLDGDTQGSDVEIGGRESRSFPAGSTIGDRAVSVDFHAVMKVPLKAGRYLERADESSRRAVINETAARRYFAGENPVGRTIGCRGSKLFETLGTVRCEGARQSRRRGGSRSAASGGDGFLAVHRSIQNRGRLPRLAQ